MSISVQYYQKIQMFKLTVWQTDLLGLPLPKEFTGHLGKLGLTKLKQTV